MLFPRDQLIIWVTISPSDTFMSDLYLYVITSTCPIYYEKLSAIWAWKINRMHCIVWLNRWLNNPPLNLRHAWVYTSLCFTWVQLLMYALVESYLTFGRLSNSINTWFELIEATSNYHEAMLIRVGRMIVQEYIRYIMIKQGYAILLKSLMYTAMMIYPVLTEKPRGVTHCIWTSY